MHINDLFGNASNRTIKGSLFGNEEEIKGQWIGEPAKRQEFILKFINRIPLFEGYFVGIYRWEDEKGNQVIWFASKDPQAPYAEGETYRIRATVKRHSVYEGRRQTQIIRLRSLGMIPKSFEPGAEKVSWDDF